MIFSGSICLLCGSSPALAQTNKYFCATLAGNPATMMRTIYGDVPIIRWTSGLYLAGQSPRQRCDTAANGLQRAFDRDALLIRAGMVDQELPVLCAVSVPGGECSHANTVLSLSPETDPNIAQAILLNIRWLSSLTPLYQGSDDLLFVEGGFTYTDLNNLEAVLICAELPPQNGCM